MQIITNEKVLREKSKAVPTPLPEGYYRLVKDLELALAESERDGVGLAAIQIGVPLRVSIIRTPNLNLNLYNAKIVEGSDTIKFQGEGCLSVPDIYVTTYRMNKVTVLNGDGELHKLCGLNAIVVQHELDHWDGILMTDREIKDTGGI